MADQPRVFISYSHDSPEHSARVLTFANRLVGDGIDCVLDQYEPHPREPWPRWMERQLAEADFVLVVCTETYLRRASGREEPGRGQGATFESVLIFQKLYDAGMWNEKFIAVLLDGMAAAHVPTPLRGYRSYRIDTDLGYEDLYRHLTNQPRFAKPSPGSIWKLPPEQPASDQPGFRNSSPDETGPVESNRATVSRQPVLRYSLLFVGFAIALAVLLWISFVKRWRPGPDRGVYGFEVSPNPVRLSPGDDLSLAVGWRDEQRVFNVAQAESWLSDLPDIATVTHRGEVKALRPGGTGIYVLARSPQGVGAARGWIDVMPEQTLEASLGSSGRQFVILGINDVYRIEGANGGATGGLARVRQLRLDLEQKGQDVLLLHAGDFLFPSLMSRWFQGEQMVDVMNVLDGDSNAFDSRMFVTFGNHEFDRSRKQDAEFLRSRLDQSQFTWLGSNVVFAQDNQGRDLVAAPNLSKSAIVEIGGARIGLIGLTAQYHFPEYVTRFAEPLEAAKMLTGALRQQGAELVVAVTHLQLQEDVKLLQRLGDQGPDLIIGGHEHEAQAQLVDGRWVRKADMEAQSATVVHVREGKNGTWSITPELKQLGGSSPSPNPEVQQVIARWTERYDTHFCSLQGKPQDCLRQPLGFTRTKLIGEEQSIRSVETSLGNFIADQMRAAFAGEGAQVAFINSGSLRLNRNLPPGSPITRRDFEELFAYPTPLHLLRINGEMLGQIAQHAAEGWPGAGQWLQVSGFAFRFDPASRQVSDLTLLAPGGGRRAIRPDEQILAVTSDYLVNPLGDQDGYIMLKPEQVVSSPQDGTDLKYLIQKALSSAGFIEPRFEGRICNTLTPGPCLAISGTR